MSRGVVRLRDKVNLGGLRYYKAMRFVEWEAVDLLPAEWDGWRGGRVFNPGLLADGDGYILAYRAVFTDGYRRIGMCRLDGQFRVVAGSRVAWSDHAEGEGWFADPRLYEWAGRVYIYWNTGWGEGENSQYLQELDRASLRPAGSARRLDLLGERQRIEKNWMLFGDSPGRAMYVPRPLRLLQFEWPKTECRLGEERQWDDGGYEARFGPLRGGAPPAMDSGAYWCVAHSVAYAPEGFRYWPAVFRFRGDGVVTDRPRAPLALPNPHRCRRRLPRLNPYVGEVIYPCGMARAGNDWAISYGINDERCAVAVMTREELAAAIERVE